MSRIIYGVSGEGSGHTSRAREMIRHLQSQGHEIQVVTYDRGYAALKNEFDCFEIEGLHIVSIDNKVNVIKTLRHNLGRACKAWKRNRELAKLFDRFAPDCVITDFEPATAWLAMFRKIPLISLDNQHRMRFMKFRVPAALLPEKWLTRLIIALMIPRPDAALATSLFMGETTNNTTWIFPPMVRQDVLDLTATEQDHYLVYVTSAYNSLTETLRHFPDKTFYVYGHHQARIDGNVHFRQFSTDGFLADLAACKAVIATAGFTLISEAMYLGKPFLALPMEGQFEQQVNAIFLHETGCGIKAERASVQVLDNFFASHQSIRSALVRYNSKLHTMGYSQYGGDAIKQKLDELLSDNRLIRQLNQEQKITQRSA